VHLPAGTMHWFRYGEGGDEMISMTSREAASHFFTDVDRAISPETPNILKLVEVANQMVLVWFCPSSTLRHKRRAQPPAGKPYSPTGFIGQKQL
jgi:hypothetical protein